MREFWTWFVMGLLAAWFVLAGAFIVFGAAHAEPAGTFPACAIAESLRA